MKKLFNKILGCYRKLKKLKCQIGLAQEELRETNKELEAKKMELKELDDMCHEEQEKFAEICYDIRRKKEELLDVNEKCRKGAGMFKTIILRYKVMHKFLDDVAWKLRKFKVRTAGIDDSGAQPGTPEENRAWTELLEEVMEVMEEAEKLAPEVI